jgi:hypothetical protein
MIDTRENSLGSALAGSGLCATLVLAVVETIARGTPAALSIGVYLLTVPFLLRLIGRQQMLFLAACAASGGALWAAGEFRSLERALSQGVGLGVLLVALIWLRFAAKRSTSLAQVSRAVASQRRSARHLGLGMASHFIGILLNVGIFGLMAPLVSEARASLVDKRDMALSVLRGFGFTMLWAPTAAAQVVITSVVPGVTWHQLAPRAAGMAMSLIAVSWFSNWWMARGTPAPLATGVAVQPLSILVMVGNITAMIALILALHIGFSYSLTISVTLSSLLIATLWVIAQEVRRGDRGLASALARHLTVYVRQDLARGAPEVVTLSAAGFLGISISALIPGVWLDAIMVPLARQGDLLYVTVTLLVPFISAIGLNPLVSASIIGGSFAAIPPEHLEPAMLAFALASGWAVAYGISPFTTGAVVLGQSLGVRAETIVWRWNGRFTLLVLAYAAAVVWVVSVAG